MRPGLRLCSEATGKAERAAAGAPWPASANVAASVAGFLGC